LEVSNEIVIVGQTLPRHVDDVCTDARLVMYEFSKTVAKTTKRTDVVEFTSSESEFESSEFGGRLLPYWCWPLANVSLYMSIRIIISPVIVANSQRSLLTIYTLETDRQDP